MRQLVFVGLLFGLVNAVAAAAALFAVNGAAPGEFGWFAYAPLTENVAYDYYGFPWEYVVVPAVLLALNALLLPLFVRRGWLRR
jgi:heme/copper-type cytochrome/quinol oxidase subunit 1